MGENQACKTRLISDALLSTGLTEFMEALDKRLSKKQQSSIGLQLVAKKVRSEGTLSERLPPPDAPVWAVSNPGKTPIPP